MNIVYAYVDTKNMHACYSLAMPCYWAWVVCVRAMTPPTIGTAILYPHVRVYFMYNYILVHFILRLSFYMNMCTYWCIYVHTFMARARTHELL